MSALRNGEPVAGVFWPAGCTDAQREGFLRWRQDDGALLELVTPAKDWTTTTRGEQITIHGELRGLGDVSLLLSWPKTWELDDRAFRFFSPTLALGDHTTPDRKWQQAVYSSGHLSEWRNDTGLSHSRPRRGAVVHRVDIRRPATDAVAVPRAQLQFTGALESNVVRHGPDWSAMTRQDMVVQPRTPRTIDSFRRDFAEPLVTLTAFVAGRQDTLIREVLFDPETRARVEILEAGRREQPREWLRNPRLLFEADELTDFGRVIKRWWKTYNTTWPALSVFSAQYDDGNTYSPARLITVVSALEAYGRARHKTTDLAKLRTYSGVSSMVTGCTNAALTLIGVARGYFAHLSTNEQKYTVEQIQASILPSTRIASALFQSCLLRDVGFSAAKTAELLQRHYASWPLV